jgi:hypothetical protein
MKTSKARGEGVNAEGERTKGPKMAKGILRCPYCVLEHLADSLNDRLALRA